MINHPQEKEMKKAKWLSEEEFAKGKGEKEKIDPFECRVPKNSKERDKKVYLSDQCKKNRGKQ